MNGIAREAKFANLVEYIKPDPILITKLGTAFQSRAPCIPPGYYALCKDRCRGSGSDPIAVKHYYSSMQQDHSETNLKSGWKSCWETHRNCTQVETPPHNLTTCRTHWTHCVLCVCMNLCVPNSATQKTYEKRHGHKVLQFCLKSNVSL